MKDLDLSDNPFGDKGLESISDAMAKVYYRRFVCSFVSTSEINKLFRFRYVGSGDRANCVVTMQTDAQRHCCTRCRTWYSKQEIDIEIDQILNFAFSTILLLAFVIEK